MDEGLAQYLLLAESVPGFRDSAGWRFVLLDAAGGQITAAADVEPRCTANRAATLAVVRGLEAIDTPGHVSLLTSSRYVKRALAHQLREWKQADWQWECFGCRRPVRNADLWRRVDRALQFHSVASHSWDALPSPIGSPTQEAAERSWTPFAGDVPVDAPAEQQSYAPPEVAAYEPDPAVIVVRKRRNRYSGIRDAARRAIQQVGDQITGLLEQPVAQAS